MIPGFRVVLGAAALITLTALTPELAQAQVSASLVSAEASVQPGRRFVVAVRLQHDTPWHTYWLNPGVGEATSIEWKLPEGWRASKINWPTPIAIHGTGGSITGHGYGGVIYLPVTITPASTAAAGQSVTFVAEISWLMCTTEACIPDGAQIQLTLPVSAGPPAPNAEVRAELEKMPLPKAPPVEWTLQASLTGDHVTLQIGGADEIKSPHFFSATELIAYDSAQKLKRAGNNQILTLPVDKYFDDKQDELIGVLAYTDASGAYTGVQIAVPFSQTGAAAAAAKSLDAGASPTGSRPVGSSISGSSQAGSSVAGSVNAESSGAESGGAESNATGSAVSASGLTASDTAISSFAGVDSMSLLQALGLAFLGGLILNLMPCVLPIQSLKALSLTRAGGTGAGAMRRVLLHTVGVLVSFAIVAGALIGLKAAAGGVGWRFHLQSPFVVLALALVMAAVGFNLLGVFEFGARRAGIGQALTQRESGRASFFTGVLAVVVAAPCTAPFMAAPLGYALVQPAFVALVVFLALGLGFATPFLLVSCSSAAHRRLPRPGPWMVAFKQALAFPMFLTAVWLLWVLGRQTGVDGMAAGALAITLLGVSVWALGRSGAAARAAPWRLTTAASLVPMIGSAVIGLDAGEARASNIAAAGATAHEGHEEVPYSLEVLQQLLNEGRPVFAYFTADWCITCKVNERVALRREETSKLFAEYGTTVMVGDWTHADPAITEMLSAYGRAGVPTYLYFPAGASLEEGRLLPQILTPAILRSHIESASQRS